MGLKTEAEYAAERYYVVCQKCGRKALNVINGHTCIKCDGDCKKV